METDKLSAMANQIAAFFRVYPADEARVGIRQHLEAFWTPKMREAMLARGPHAGLDPLVAAALWPELELESGSASEPGPAAANPVRQRVFEPEVGGALMSDAG